MPTYLTADELKDEWTAARVNDLSGGDDTEVEKAIEKVERQVEGVLSSRYGGDDLDTIRSQVPGTVKDIVSDMALFELFKRRGFDQPAPDAVMAHDNGRRRLSLIGRGQENLNLSGDHDVDKTRKKFASSKSADDAAFSLSSGPLSCW